VNGNALAEEMLLLALLQIGSEPDLPVIDRNGRLFRNGTNP
jgi:hypothetical protein